jgi:hypothetical protein
MTKQFLILMLQLVIGGVVGAAFIALLVFVTFSLGDSIFVTGGGV